MKKIMTTIMLISTAQSALAGPISPMRNYTPTDIADEGISVDTLWRHLDPEMKNKDCFRRAHLWSYDMYHDYGVKSKKIFIHYTKKWNEELDDMGRDKLGWLKRKFFKAPGISKQDMRELKGNKRWAYHVAPMVVDNGQNVVMDRTLNLAYDAIGGVSTGTTRWKRFTRPATPNEWAEALTVRGEILWEIRKANMLYELEKDSTDYSEKRHIVRKMQELGMIDGHGNDIPSIDIKCKKVDNIAQVDSNTYKEWCYLTEAPMYYWTEISLRLQAYGRTGFDYNYTVDNPAIQTEENYQNGRNFVMTSFSKDHVKQSEKERKRGNSRRSIEKESPTSSNFDWQHFEH